MWLWQRLKPQAFAAGEGQGFLVDWPRGVGLYSGGARFVRAVWAHASDLRHAARRNWVVVSANVRALTPA